MSEIFQQLESNNKEEVEAIKQKILEQFISGRSVVIACDVEFNVFFLQFEILGWLMACMIIT